MNIPNFYIIEMLKDVNIPFNRERYNEGVRVVANYINSLNSYLVANIGDMIPKSSVKILFQFEGREYEK